VIIRIWNQQQLRGPIGNDLFRCIKDYCKRGKEELKPQEVWDLMLWHLNNNQSFSLWLALDKKYRVQGFAMLRIIRDDGCCWVGDIWKVYIKPGAKKVIEEGLMHIEKWFSEQGVTEITFGTKRNPKAWERVLRRFGFKIESTIFSKNLRGEG
jgi:hypothetical protein